MAVSLALAAFIKAPGAAVPQVTPASDVTESALEAASGGSSIRVGPGAGAAGRAAAIPLEVYVARVLAGEGERDAADAAREALAVAIRTYAVANAGRHLREGFDVCDSTHCQVVRASTAATRRAALMTAGQLLTYDGAAAEVFYSASCGGYSESAGAVWPGAAHPYLQARPDDVHGGDEPWTLALSARELERAVASSGFRGRLRDVRVAERSASGRATRIELEGLTPQAITGDRLRAAIGPTRLRSAAFSVMRTGDAIRFTGRGFGHGVGLCVVGAGRRAARGESTSAILERYYPGLVLTRIGGGPVRAVGGTPARRVDAGPPRRQVRSVIVQAPSLSAEAAVQVEESASGAHDALSTALGVSVVPITVRVHDSIESFRTATGRPWWVRSVSSGTTIHLVPLAALGPADEWRPAIGTAVADLLLAEPLARRPLWVRVGAARFFARDGGRRPGNPPATTCPSDAALTGGVSAAALREAEARAEACFERQYARTRDWRTVR
jgi:SpoIID/LytB domain protein